MINKLNEYIKSGIAVYSKELDAIAIELNDETRGSIIDLNNCPRESSGWTVGLVDIIPHTSLDDWVIVQGHDPTKHRVKNGVKEVDFITLKKHDRLIFVIDRNRKFVRIDVMRR